ncbi:hypothetical protein BGX28_000127 [Mortierella sp. GBA30]|nr:hypothetical protein BGX28_000127 [Mortierella sp. GBA30]
MKTLKSLSLGLVLSLSLSSDLLRSASAQTSAAPKPTGTATSGAPAPAPTTPGVRGPSSFIFVAAAASKNNIFYHGGSNGSAVSNELFSLDLTKTWPVSNPAWANLNPPKSGSGGPSSQHHSATVSKDGSTLLVTGPADNSQSTPGPFLYQYNIDAGTWSTVNAPAAQAAAWVTRKDTGFVTDPTTGISWLVGGTFADGSSTNSIDKFESNAWTAAVTAKPAGGGSSAAMNSFYGGTAEIYNSKIYIFGGFSVASGQRSYQSFQYIQYIDVSDPSNPTYGTQGTMGPTPDSRHYHCSVLTDSAKVIIYGGFSQNTQTTFQDLWSLDLITMTWSQILTTNGASPKYGHSCNMAGANMVVHGGVANGKNGSFTGFIDIQVYDVMLSSWMNSYAPKRDTTPVTPSSSGGNDSKTSGGIGIGAIIGIVAGALVIIGVIFGVIFYQRRQKQIEIREAEMEKEAYLASLRPEGEQGNHPSPGQGRISTPGMSHTGLYGGMDERLLQSAAASPGMGGQGQGNVQYLMQHLPDGTIAVQPVYLDHQAIQMQASPNMAAMATEDPGYVSPPISGAAPPGAYFSPPPSHSNNNIASSPSPSAAASPYVMPPSQHNRSQVTFPQPTHDPFASPSAAHAPLPPGYGGTPAALGLGSPQQMHPEHSR